MTLISLICVVWLHLLISLFLYVTKQVSLLHWSPRMTKYDIFMSNYRFHCYPYYRTMAEFKGVLITYLEKLCSTNDNANVYSKWRVSLSIVFDLYFYLHQSKVLCLFLFPFFSCERDGNQFWIRFLIYQSQFKISKQPANSVLPDSQL